jgi:hypothetical protein
MDLMARRRAIMGMPSGKDYTVTGNVVSISNALAKNAKSLIVSFSPKQSGSGDPSPSNVRPISGYNDIGAVRYGKNLYDISSQTSPTTSNTYLILDVKPNTDYVFSVDVMQSGLYVQYDNNGTWTNIKVAYDKTFIAFNSGNHSTIRLMTYRASSASIPTQFQLEYGTTATQYEPYISPVTANVHVGGAGKNKCGLNASEATNLGWNVTFPFTIKAGTYIVSCQQQFGGTTSKGASISLRDADNNNLMNLTGYDFGDTLFVGYPQVVSEAVAAATTKLYFSCRESMDSTEIQSIVNAKIQIEEGTTATSYEPYSLFGGTVDLVSGECVVDRAIIDLGTLNWYFVTTGTYPFFESGTITGANKEKGCVCSAYKGIMAQNGTYWRDGSHPLEIGFNKSGGSPYTRVQDSNYTDATSFKSAVSGVMLCYELATPITYQLTPSQLALLKGNNTVYSNEGSISLIYVGK